MLRVMRLKRDDLPAQWLSSLNGLDAFINGLRLPPEVASLIARPVFDGDYINFVTPLNGAMIPVPVQDLTPRFFDKNMRQGEMNFLSRREQLINALRPYLTIAPNNSQELSHYDYNAVSLVKVALENPQYLFLIEGREPVVLPFWDHNFYDSLLKARPDILGLNTTVDPNLPDSRLRRGAAGISGVAGAAGTAGMAGAALHAEAPVGGTSGAEAGVRGVHHHRVLPWLLVGLGLIALAGILWFFLVLEPQRQEAERERLKQELIYALDSELRDDETNLEKVNALLDKIELRLELAHELADKADLARLFEQADQDKTNLSRVNHLLARVSDALQQAEQRNAASSKPPAVADTNIQKAAPIPGAAMVLKAGAAAVAAKKQNQSSTAQTAPKKLPKCSVIKKEGKMPNLIIALDGSGSMLTPLPDGSLRINAAIKAAESLINKVDRNVPIRLFGIQGCPLARDYGLFTERNRGALKQAVRQVNPMLASSPLMVMTPLVTALRGMTNTAPVDADAVGVLISDGVDTCKMTEKTDLCALAHEMHQKRPRLKVHVVLIGEDAPNAGCIAEITGGKVYRPDDTDDIITSLQSAGATLERVCVEE